MISTIILNLIPQGVSAINISAGTKISSKAWEINKPKKWCTGGSVITDSSLSEAEVIIKDGELLSGILDKNHIGSTPFGLIHCFYELYGGDCSTALLSSLSKVFTFYLQLEGFTLGVKDILVIEKAEKKRQNLISSCRNAGQLATVSALEQPCSEKNLKIKIEEAYTKNPKFKTILDRKYKQVLDGFNNDINKICIPIGLVNKFPQNNLQLMVSVSNRYLRSCIISNNI